VGASDCMSAVDAKKPLVRNVFLRTQLLMLGGAVAKVSCIAIRQTLTNPVAGLRRLQM